MIMTIKQIMNTLIDTNSEMLEAYLDDQDDDIFTYYIGKLAGQLDFLKAALKEKDLM